MAKSPDLFQREWQPLDKLVASAMFYGHNAKITQDEKGITFTFWFPWTKPPHKESTDGKAEDQASAPT